MDLGLRDKTVIVTGGASNIGRRITLTFAAEGAKVFIADLDPEQAGRVAKEATEGTVHVIETDVTNLESVQEMAARVANETGGIDSLVNGVGWWTEPSFFLDSQPDQWRKLVDVNYLGVVHCLHAVLPQMVRQGGGSVVSIASDAALMGEFKSAVYSGAKAGLLGLTKAIAREVGPHGVRLNLVCPGATFPESGDVVSSISPWKRSGSPLDRTPDDRLERMKKAYPLRRLAEAQDIANAAVFLCSEASSFITGQTLSVSGGFSMA